MTNLDKPALQEKGLERVGDPVFDALLGCDDSQASCQVPDHEVGRPPDVLLVRLRREILQHKVSGCDSRDADRPLDDRSEHAAQRLVYRGQDKMFERRLRMEN